MSTTVINLFAGSGSGKSTTAALLFGEMKLLGYNVELVTEYVKTLAWRNIKIDELDQLVFLGKQIEREKNLYGKVDYIITDSPILLCGIYQEYYSKGKRLSATDACLSYLNHVKDAEVKHLNYFINRGDTFNPKGRYETFEQAKEIDIFVRSFLNKHYVEYKEISTKGKDRVTSILNDVV